jgi:hypothetical protein
MTVLKGANKMTADGDQVAEPERGPALRCLLAAWLVALFPPLHVAVLNPGQVSWQGIAVVLAAMTVAVLVLAALLRTARYPWPATLIGIAGLVVMAFGYGPLHSWLDVRATTVATEVASDLPPIFRIAHEHLFALWGVLCGVWLLVVGRLGAVRIENMAKAMPVATGVLYLFLVAQGASRAFLPSDSIQAGPADGGRSNAGRSAIGYDPDIYYIVLDGYARGDVLERHYGDGNARFLDALRSRGFVVAGSSTANYYWTFLSLASSLNFQYLDKLVGDATEAQLRGRRPFYRAIRDNEAARYLRGRGYRYLHFQSTWGGTLRNEFADEQVSCQGSVFLDDYTRAVVELTPIKMLASSAAVDLADCYRSHFASLAKLGSAPGPKFVFAHFLPPHHPYLFDREGRTLRSATISDQFEFQKKLWERRDLYLDQLSYVNARVLEAVDGILAASDRPPIILIQSDHGPNLQDGLSVADQRAIRFANLSVALLPGAPEGLLPDDGSAVNKLPLIFNYYFGAELPIRPDRHFYSTYAAPFDLEPVGVDGATQALQQARLGGEP